MPAERAVIERLLSVEFRDAEFFRAQVPHITVTHVCSCGCGTIDFAVDHERAERAPSAAWDDSSELIAQASAPAWLMLFQHAGYLTDLEHVAGHGPRPDELDPASIAPELMVEGDITDT
jgi:hypothetical protein